MDSYKNSVEYQLWLNPYIFLLISVDFKSSLSFVKNYLGELSLTRSAIDLSGVSSYQMFDGVTLRVELCEPGVLVHEQK